VKKKGRGMNIFENLFILEIANNHLGSVDRGLKIIQSYAAITRFNNIRAAVKMQFRDVDTFIHKDWRTNQDIRYIKKTIDTQMGYKGYEALTNAIRKSSLIPMATPFDEKSVDWCVELGIDIIKIASSDINDWMLIEKIGKTRKPVVFSTGGSSLKDVDDVVKYFTSRYIPIAIMHCVSLYPTHDCDLDLNQIDFLHERYPQLVVGLSSHECTDWSNSMMIAYGKGARIFERHVDIEGDGVKVSPYCSLPHQIDRWFKSYHKAVEMCGAPGISKRIPPEAEIQYLDALVRGVYAKRDLKQGHVLRWEDVDKDVYLAIPLQKGQISCQEFVSGEVLLQNIEQDKPIMVDMIDSPYAGNEGLKKIIYRRGI
jgi:sialic acid synthase SpsE